MVYNDHSIYVWDLKNIKQIGKTHSFLYHSACVWDICVSLCLHAVYTDLCPDYLEFGPFPGPNINPCSGTQYQSMFRDSISIHVLELNINPRSGTQNQSMLWDSVSSVYALGLGITPFLGQMLGSSPVSVKLMLSPRAWTDT